MNLYILASVNLLQMQKNPQSIDKYRAFIFFYRTRRIQNASVKLQGMPDNIAIKLP